MELTCITVSTKYDDLLKIIMPQNYQFFKTWYIITDQNDSKTIETINNFNYPNVNTIFYDFYKDGKIFNKGGAIKHVQQMIPDNTLVLLLDSDIYLPDDFMNYLKKVKLDNNLYSPKVRYDYYSYNSFINNKHDKLYRNNFYGFFQLFTQTKDRLYTDSEDASLCDDLFRDLFKKNKIILNDIIIKHLGQDRVNWKGRNKIDFI